MWDFFTAQFIIGALKFLGPGTPLDWIHGVSLGLRSSTLPLSLFCSCLPFLSISCMCTYAHAHSATILLDELNTMSLGVSGSRMVPNPEIHRGFFRFIDSPSFPSVCREI